MENDPDPSFEQHVRNFVEFWQNRPDSYIYGENDEIDDIVKTNSSKCCGIRDKEMD